MSSRTFRICKAEEEEEVIDKMENKRVYSVFIKTSMKLLLLLSACPATMMQSSIVVVMSKYARRLLQNKLLFMIEFGLFKT